MNLLFDEHSSGSYFASQAEIDKKHTVICVGHHEEMKAGIEDKKIMKVITFYSYNKLFD